MPNLFSRHRKFHRYAILALVALFFLLSLPLLPKVSRWRGDERFYTDAAISMAHHGNILTPTYSDGTNRFRKPILTYWVVLLSYKTLGVNYWASRLPFLLAGTLFVGLTYYFALILIRRRPEALVASAVMASNVAVLYLSIRSTPDILLALFILISMMGFANIIFKGRRSTGNYASAYLGAALAIATKGIFGLLPVLFVLGWVMIARPPGIRTRDLIHIPLLLASLPVALFWFIVAFTQHGDAAISDFWKDQVGERFSGSKSYILSNAGVYLSSFVLQLLPWSFGALVFLYHGRRKRASLFLNHRREVLFSVSWTLLLFAIFCVGNIQRTRYFLPAYPHLAVLIAMLLCAGFRHKATRPLLKRIFLSLCWIVLAIGVSLMIGGGFIHIRLLMAGVIIVGLSAFLLTRFTRWPPAFLMAGFASLIMTLISVLDIGVRPLFFVSAAPEMTRQILALYPSGTPVAMVGVPPIYESQVRVLSGNRINPDQLSARPSKAEINQYSILVFAKKDFEAGKRQPETVIGKAYGVNNWRAKDIKNLLLSKDKEAIWASRRQEYYLVRP